MQTSSRGIYCIHAQDESTEFLNDFQTLKFTDYFILEPGDDSIGRVLGTIKAIEPLSNFVFLGHGFSSGLYTPAVAGYDRKIYINPKVGNKIFQGHDILLLSCRSADFIRYLNTYNSILGFGNIPSSLEEISHEAEHSGHFRNLSQEDIDHFNKSYVHATMSSVKLLIENKITFRMLPFHIAFHINKEINGLLRRKDKSNRIELAALLFEFRNEMIYKKKI